MDLDEAGKLLFGGEANAGVAFQIGQLRCFVCSNKDVHGIYIFLTSAKHVHTGLFLWQLCGISMEVSLSTRYLSGLFTSLCVSSTRLCLARLTPGGFWA